MGNYDWLLTMRGQIMEGYSAPLYPTIDYDAEHAAELLEKSGSNLFRFPALGYYAFYPTAHFPVHPELKGRDLLRETIDACHRRGIKVIPYIPVGHPFMPIDTDLEPYNSWAKIDENGKRSGWWHIGYFEAFDICINRRPYREAIKNIVNEIVTQYDVDGIYFDGPYQDAGSRGHVCHCPDCQEDYFKKTGKPLPANCNGQVYNDPEISEYLNWSINEMVDGLMRELNAIIKQKDIPHLFNNCGWLHTRTWGNDRFAGTDGFLFEGYHTTHEKLLHIMLGRSTGNYVWSYISGIFSTQHDHIVNDDIVRGADCIALPVDGDEVKSEGFTVVTGNGTPLYWATSRIYYQDDTVRNLQDVYGFIAKNEKVLEKARSKKFIGLWVSGDTADWWFKDNTAKTAKYKYYFYGAFNVLKDYFHQAEPFFHSAKTDADLSAYRVLFLPNAACMSDGEIASVRKYVQEGGTLIATFMTSLFDEKGNKRENFGLADVFGADWCEQKPVRFRPQCYLKFIKESQITEGFKVGQMIPQDIQFLQVNAHHPEDVIATTSGVDHDIDISPAIIARKYGKGSVVYLPESLEALYRTSRYQALGRLFDNIFRSAAGTELPYEIDGPKGLVVNLAECEGISLLHMINDNGNKIKFKPTREHYVPIFDIKVRIKIGTKEVREARLLKTDQSLDYNICDGYLETTIPRIDIYECLEISFA